MMMTSRRFIIVKFFSSTYRRWQQTPNSLSSSNVLFINSKKRQQWVDIHRCFFFCLRAFREDNDELALVIIFFCLYLCTQRRWRQAGVHHRFFLFCLYASRENNYEPMLVIVFFCFVSVHLEKTMTNANLSSSFFVLSLCT